MKTKQERIGVLSPDYTDKSKIIILSSDTGKKISEIKVNGIPSHDGLALADAHLFLSTIDGKVICFE